MAKVNLGGILDHKNSLFFGYELAQNIESGGFSRTGATANQNVLARENVVLEPVGERPVERSSRNQVLDFEVAGVELANRQRDAIQARRWNNDGNTASIREP